MLPVLLSLLLLSPVSEGDPLHAVFPPEMVLDGQVFLCGSPTSRLTPQNWFGHLGKEAGRLERFGGVSLRAGRFQGAGGILDVDIMELPTPELAYGLYRDRGKCSGSNTEEALDSGRIMVDGSLGLALGGRFVLKAESSGPRGADGFLAPLLKEVLSRLGRNGISRTGVALESLAVRPCEVEFEPGDVDSRFRSGPGFRLRTGGGAIVFLQEKGDEEEALALWESLPDLHAGAWRREGRWVGWTSEFRPEAVRVLEKAMKAVAEAGRGPPGD